MKGNIKWIVIFAILCAICAAWRIFTPKIKTEHQIAVIKQGNTVIRTVDLSNVSEAYEFNVTDGSGRYNTIRVEHGRIAVTDADCPDKICIKRGFISSGELPIVCLPHKLSISITGAADNFDAVAGGN